MKKDVYETLGVPKDADEATIKKAYRRRARKAHPDKGGSTEDMADVNHAYAVLSDSARRLHYDACGEDEVQQSPESVAHSLISEAFRAALAKLHEDGAGRMHPLAFAKRFLGEKLAAKEQERIAMRRAHEFLAKQRGRVKRRNRKGPDIYASLLEVEMRQLDGALIVAGRRIEELERAIEMLRDDYLDADPPADVLNAGGSRIAWVIT